MSSREKNRTTGPGRFHVGIDAGSVSVNCIVIDEGKEIVYEAPYARHFGRVDEQVLALVEDLRQRFGKENLVTLSFTGNHGKSLSERLHAFYEFDTISQVLGATFVTPEVRTIISMGGQDTALFQIGYDSKGGTPGGMPGPWNISILTARAPRGRDLSSISRRRDWLPPSMGQRPMSPRKELTASFPISSGLERKVKNRPTWPADARYLPNQT